MRWVTATVAVVVLLAGCSAAYVTGMGPAPGNSEDLDSFPTERPPDSGADSGGSGASGGTSDATSGSGETSDGTATPTGPSFALDIDRIEQCGETCRDVTTTLTNRRSTTADGVTVYTRIFAGNGTDGDVVWEGKDGLGSLAPGESVTTTERVELSYGNAMAVRNDDGWVTIRTTVQSDSETVTVAERRQVG